MGVEIKLTDRHFPASPVFIDFLHRHLHGEPFEASWHDQLSEALKTPDGRIKAHGEEMAASVLGDPLGQRAILRSYELLTAILTGDATAVEHFRDRYRFVCVVGCPRHGGSYLTKQLFLALGFDPSEVPNVIAHDGFPDASPFEFRAGYNAYTTMMQNMAEYFAMIEVFFANSRLYDNRVIVPKKATKAAYHGAFFNAMFGPDTEYVITLRHPVAACISTYDKSTGLPEDGRFRVRSNIEEWARRDNAFTGAQFATPDSREYFDVYLRYWEQYHYQLALTGLAANPNWKVVAYGEAAMHDTAAGFFTRCRSTRAAEPFRVFDHRGRHPQWWRAAQPALHRVQQVWATIGRTFPIDELMQGW